MIACWDTEPRSSRFDALFKNRDILYCPVTDEKSFNRLLALAPTCDAAVLTLLNARWKPARISSKGRHPEELYVLMKLGVLELPDRPTRVAVAAALVKSESLLWGTDAWRLAAQLDREEFLYQAAQNVWWSRDPFRVAVLCEVTGQNFGFDAGKWQAWVAETRVRCAR